LAARDISQSLGYIDPEAAKAPARAETLEPA
jgi:hypothetical protein